MKALVFDSGLRLADLAPPERRPGEVLIRVTKAGICSTDHEITRGYMPGFHGILGHEFLGIAMDADDRSIVGCRVSAEINCGCGACDFCRLGMGRHCPDRTVIGIQGRSGSFAEFIAVPKENVVAVPHAVPDLTAIFVEPLAAALEICDQIPLENRKVLLLGDGKLGLLIAMVLSAVGCDSLVIGKHAENLDKIDGPRITTGLLADFTKKQFDVVIEASGNPEAFPLALECVKPRGTLVLKSTYAHGLSFNPSPIVVNEITVVGSRCGRFSGALAFMEKFRPNFSPMIAREFLFDRALEGFEFSQGPGVLKVVLTF